MLNNNKAAGPDKLPTEILKLIEWYHFHNLVELINTFNQWVLSTFITLAKHCFDYRPISLMTQILKILLKVVNNRIFRIYNIHSIDDIVNQDLLRQCMMINNCTRAN